MKFMPNDIYSRITDFIDSNPETIEKLREFVAQEVSQKLKEELLSTPDGERLSEEIRSVFTEEIRKLDFGYNQAIEQTAVLVEQNGASPETAQEIRRVFSDPKGCSKDNVNKIVEKLKEETPSDTPAPMKSITEVIREDTSLTYDKTLYQGATGQLKPKSNSLDPSGTVTEHINRCSTEKLNSGNITPADYAVISKLAYASNFSDDQAYRIACEMDGKDVTVKQYCENLLANGSSLSSGDREFLRAMADNPRYADLHLDHSDTIHVGEVNTHIIAVRTDDNHAVIGIQGTNSDITDWVNDVQFAGDELTPEEKWINERIYSYLDQYDTFDITGHSQGGRDAISAAAFLPEEYKDNLRSVYSLDGPGYSPEFLAKYGYLFEDIEENITHVYPKDSIVGHILASPGGNVMYVDATDKGIHNHSLGKWVFNDDGSLVPPAGGDAGLWGKILRPVTTYAAGHLSLEEREVALPVIMRMFADPDDPTNIKLDGKTFLENLDKVSFGDGLILAATAAVVIGESYLDFYDAVSPYIDGATAVLTVLSLIPWPGAPACAAILGFIESVSAVLDTIAVICEIAVFISHIFLEYKARKQAQERKAYLQQNPKIKVAYAHFERAVDHLERANQALARADKAGDSMWSCFKQDKVKETETILDDIIKVVFEIVSFVLSVADAKTFIKKSAAALIDLGYLQQSSHVSKGVDAINRVVAASRSIPTSAGVEGAEEEFSVIPSSLSEKAEKAQKYVEVIARELQDTDAVIKKTGNLWIADDYDSIHLNTSTNLEDILDVIEKMEDMYEGIQSIAAAYQSLQNTSVQEFQAAAN